MQWLPDRENSRPVAIGLAVVALGLIYLVFFHWFVSAHGRIGEELAVLEEQAARFKAAINRREDLEARLGNLEEARLDSALFFGEDSLSLAAAQMTRTLRQTVREESNQSELCRVTATENRAPDEEERFEQVTVNVRMRCPLDDLTRVIYALESNTPMIFIDSLIVQQRGGRSRRGSNIQGALEVRFDMFGYRSELQEPSDAGS